MSESIVNALVHLFAIFESVKEDFQHDSGELVVKPYLKKTLNQELTAEYLNLFYDYLSFYREANQNPSGDHELGIDSTSIIQIAKICNQINKELELSQRITVFIELLELIRADGKVSEKESEFASLVAMNFNLTHTEVEDIKAFIFEPDEDKINFENGLIIDNKMTEWPEEVAWMMRKKKAEVPGSTKYHHMFVENLFGRIFVLHLKNVNSYVFRYDGPLNLYLEGNKIIAKKAYFLNPGAIIKGPNIRSIYETEITKTFLHEKTKVNIVLNGEDLEFHFKNSTNGIQKFNFSEESGHLVGIMGGSGTGKSTLLNLLNGKMDPSKGRVHINGHTIERAGREGVIGYVPQDDLLFEELTVYQNLYFNAKICFSNFSKKRIQAAIKKLLEDLDLVEIANLKVGDPLNKSISGGQRKRLNIALELMREPSVLFVDEPTSGLSSVDSEKVMWLLKDLARTGKLVVAIIHQPSSDIYKLFDKLWLLDKGGYPIYNGNPIDAVVYFKTMSTQVNAAESECPRCGNVIPEQILHIIESKEIDDNGHETLKRRVNPKTWYLKYRENIEKNLVRVRHTERLPPTNFKIPNKLNQFKIFTQRNVLSKLSNHQYILLNILEFPVLALILAYFSKYAKNDAYVFADNKNLTVFLFMSIVVSLFFGMSVSAEEIFKDRKILARESFLNLSRLSYLNSKIVFLFSLSAVQTLSFVLIGNWIIEIKGLTFEYWMILFSTSCFANLVGLNISSALNSIINIYILIPIILVPQLLLGGAMIRFDDLHSSITDKIHVPPVGDIMVSRWAYEALAVAQFRHNKYEEHFYESNQLMSQSSFYINYILPKLVNITKNLKAMKPDQLPQFELQFELLRNELNALHEHRHLGQRQFPMVESLQPEYFQPTIADRTLDYLEEVRVNFLRQSKEATEQHDSTYEGLVISLGREMFNELAKTKTELKLLKQSSDSLYQIKRDSLGKVAFRKLRDDHFNESLSNVVTNRFRVDKVYNAGYRYVQKRDPIYAYPKNVIGRAHFFAPVKLFINWEIDTFRFNVIVIWLFTGVLYLMLIYDVLKRMLSTASRRKKKKADQRV